MGELGSKELVGGNPIIHYLVTNLSTTKGQTKFLSCDVARILDNWQL